MNIDSSEVTVKGVMPTSHGCAIFLGNDDRTFCHLCRSPLVMQLT